MQTCLYKCDYFFIQKSKCQQTEGESAVFTCSQPCPGSSQQRGQCSSPGAANKGGSQNLPSCSTSDPYGMTNLKTKIRLLKHTFVIINTDEEERLKRNGPISESFLNSSDRALCFCCWMCLNSVFCFSLSAVGSAARLCSSWRLLMTLSDNKKGGFIKGSYLKQLF